MGQSLSASELSAKSFLEWRFAQVDDGEFLAESLAEVASQQEESQQVDDTTQAEFVQQMNKAVVRLRRARAKSAMPATTEQLRHKYRLMAVDWSMVCARYPNNSWAAKYNPQTLWTGSWAKTLPTSKLSARKETSRSDQRGQWCFATNSRSGKTRRAE